MKYASSQNLGYLLIKTSRAWNQRLMEIFKSKGYDDLKPSFGAVFIPLFDKDNQNIADIMNFSNLSKQSMTVYINELKGRGYIETQHNPDDRRFVRVLLTPKGKVLKTVADGVVKQVNYEFSQQLCASQFKELLQILNKFSENVKGLRHIE
jgi:DNA-binding MarR family transcriptional regulator